MIKSTREGMYLKVIESILSIITKAFSRNSHRISHDIDTNFFYFFIIKDLY